MRATVLAALAALVALALVASVNAMEATAEDASALSSSSSVSALLSSSALASRAGCKVSFSSSRARAKYCAFKEHAQSLCCTALRSGKGVAAASPVVGTAAHGGKVLWGALIGDQFGGSPPWHWPAVPEFEKKIAGGKQMDIVHMGQVFHSTSWCGGWCYFDYFLQQYEAIRTHGKILMVTMMSGDQDNSAAAPEAFSPGAIARGSQDAFLTKWAQQAAAWKHPFFIRLDHEMNGNWYAWSPSTKTGVTAKDYIAMWRHVHGIFQRAGATNANFVWCANIQLKGQYTMAPLFPGVQYVDWMGVDGYNRGPWLSFTDLFSESYGVLQKLAPHLPIMIVEVGCIEQGGSKAAWIKDMFKVLPTKFPNIRAINWYDDLNASDGLDFRLETSKASIAAFTEGIKGSRYVVGGGFANMPGPKIHPPK